MLMPMDISENLQPLERVKLNAQGVTDYRLLVKIWRRDTNVIS